MAKRGVAYIRVSSSTQAKEGVSLEIQAAKTVEKLRELGCTDIKVFEDAGKSARTIEGRDEFIKAMDYASKHQVDYFCAYDTSRLARNAEDAQKILKKLVMRAVRLVFVTTEIENTPEGRFMFGVMSSLDEYSSAKQGARIKEALGSQKEQGIFPHCAPPGYDNIRINGRAGIILNTKYAPILQDALIKFKNRQIETQIDFTKYLQRMGFQHKWRKSDSTKLPHQLAQRILRNPFYAGYFYMPDGRLRQHVYETLISYDDYLKIQSILDGKSTPVVNYQTERGEFPLRKLVTCSECGKPMRGYFSKGRNKRYPYYDCMTKGCGNRLNPEIVHNQLNILMSGLNHSPDITKLFREVMLRTLRNNAQQQIKIQKVKEKELVGLRNTQEQALSALTDPLLTSNADLKTALMRKYSDISFKVTELENIVNSSNGENNYEPMIKKAVNYLQKPTTMWQELDVKSRRKYLKWLIPGKIEFHPKTGLRTAGFNTTYSLIQSLNEGKNIDVEMEYPFANQIVSELSQLVTTFGIAENQVQVPARFYL